jgi:hypothetical protein
MTKDEVLKLALDALEGFIPYLPLKDEAQCDRYDKAITALRLAIDVENMASKSTYKEQLETKDKPVSCAECGADGGHALYCVACAEKFIAQTETKDEPVAVVISESGADVTHSWWHEPALPIGTKLYTTPQRTLVGLTDEEIQQCLNSLPTQTIDVYARRIEAKLKEKNT